MPCKWSASYVYKYVSYHPSYRWSPPGQPSDVEEQYGWKSYKITQLNYQWWLAIYTNFETLPSIHLFLPSIPNKNKITKALKDVPSFSKQIFNHHLQAINGNKALSARHKCTHMNIDMKMGWWISQPQSNEASSFYYYTTNLILFISLRKYTSCMCRYVPFWMIKTLLRGLWLTAYTEQITQ